MSCHCLIFLVFVMRWEISGIKSNLNKVAQPHFGVKENVGSLYSQRILRGNIRSVSSSRIRPIVECVGECVFENKSENSNKR